MAGLKDTTDQIRQFWASRNGRQRAFLLGGAGATVLLLGLFVRLLGTPDYKPLFTGLDPADAQTLTAQLDAQGIPHQTSADGKTISVPADKLDAARMQTAAQGEPHSGRMGFELFDKMSWGQTEFDEKVTYQRALEGELERSIETLSDVESARVHLVLPTDSVFVDRQRDAKASVVLKLRRGELSKDSAMAIARLVAGAVDELKPEDVSIIDADTDRALGVGHNGGANGDAEGDTLTARLISTLEPVVGVDKIRASVNVDYDQGTTEESDEKYDPAVSALLSEQKTEDIVGGKAIPSGVPGTASNIPAPKGKSGSTTASNTTQPEDMQSSKSENAQYGVNKTVIHTVMPAGRVQRITAAILVDDQVVRTVGKNGKASYTTKRRSQQELDQIREIAQNVIGFDPKRGDSITVQDIAFDANMMNTDLPAPNWASKVQKTVLDYSSILRPISLLALFLMAYLFVLRPVQKHALSPGHQLPVPHEHALPAPAAQAEPLTLAAAAGDPSEESVRAGRLKEQTAELIRQKPTQTAKALQAWLREEPS